MTPMLSFPQYETSFSDLKLTHSDPPGALLYDATAMDALLKTHHHDPIKDEELTPLHLSILILGMYRAARAMGEPVDAVAECIHVNTDTAAFTLQMLASGGFEPQFMGRMDDSGELFHVWAPADVRFADLKISEHVAKRTTGDRTRRSFGDSNVISRVLRHCGACPQRTKTGKIDVLYLLISWYRQARFRGEPEEPGMVWAIEATRSMMTAAASTAALLDSASRLDASKRN